MHTIRSDTAFLRAGVHNVAFWAMYRSGNAALKTKVRVLAEEDYEEEMRFRRRKRSRWWSALLQVCCGWGFAFC